MGFGGTMEYFTGLLSSGQPSRNSRRQLETVDLKIRMDCEGCEHKVRKVLSSMHGVKSVDINMKQQKVTVIGFVEANKVLKKAKSTGKKVEFWPYVPYNIVTQPYTAQSYDKKAPAGLVRNTATTGENRKEDQYSNMFSDENPNSCSVM